MSEINLSASQLNEATPKQDTAPPGIKKWSADYRMRMKMMIFMSLIALIPLGLFFYVNLAFLHGFVSDMQQSPLVAAAGQTAGSIDSYLDDNRSTLQQAAAWPELVSYLESSATGTPSIDLQNLAKQSLQRLQQQSEGRGSISFALLGAYGENMLDTDENAVGNSELDNAYFSEPMQSGQAYVSPVIFDPSGEFLYFSVPMESDAGLTIGVLRARYNANELQALIAPQAGLVGQSSAPILIDENDVILANAVDEDQKFKLLAPIDDAGIEALQAAGRLPEGTKMESYTNLTDLKETLDETPPRNSTFFADIAGDDDWQIAYEKTTTQPWRVVFLQPGDAFSDLIRVHGFTLAFILVGLSIVVIVVALNVSRILSKPLLRLANVAQQVAGGAFGLHVPVESRDEVGLVAHAFNQVINRMRDLSGNIDQIISERTQALGSIVRALETSTKIGRQITTILDREELLRQVVNRIQIEFNFYYTHIYLVDQETGDLVMVEGSGEVGRRLKARGHRLAAGEGIVGTVAASNEFFLSNDVSKVLNYVSNEELPDTKSELALPLRKGDRVLGVLDIQDSKVNRFTSADVSLMQSIANQTAIAIDNARLLAEMQSTLKEVERLNRRLTREGWDQFENDIETPGYRFVRGTTMPLTPELDAWIPPVRRNVDQGRLVEQTHGGNGENAGDKTEELAIPLVLRGEVIGVLGVKRDEEGHWDDEEVAAVEAVANQVTLALENARLSREQEKTISQLKEVDRLKDEFLTSMSHELRTPLNSIIGFADVILQGIDGEVNDTALNDVRLIHNSGKHLLALINDVLDLAKIEAGRLELIKEDVDINMIINDVMASTTTLVLNKPVEMVKEIESDLPHIYVDEIRIKQVLINLVSNASKFTEQGSITIKVERYLENPDNFALISVIDTGIGIPPNMIKTVFDRFGQVASKKTSRVGGTGLGLPICKQLVEMHGGKIEMTSEEGVGTNIHFTVPFVGADLGEDTSAVVEKLLDAVKRL